ncbi:MAG: hypothetical protein SVV67_04960 [Bacillota bacterium]|nr:hypothetical protein [Bacillota bacterium]
MLTRRMAVSLITGAILGVVCVAGALIRSGSGLGGVYFFAFWYNRLLMGFVIGLLDGDGRKELTGLLIRGALVGLVVSFAFYSATGFGDLVGFIVGAIYGIIIEYAAYKYGQR